MIAGLHGTLDAILADAVLVSCNGVIYRAGTSTNTISELGQVGDIVRLHTHLFVREDQLTLYGFGTNDELKLFESLITVTGVGPRLACAILSRLPAELLHTAIAADNVDLLSTVPGVGRKTAARMIIELRGKLPSVLGIKPGVAQPIQTEVVEALRALGFNVAEAQTAVARATVPANATVEERIVAALRELDER